MRQGNRWWVVMTMVVVLLSLVPTLADAQRTEQRSRLTPVPQGRYPTSLGRVPADAVRPPTTTVPSNPHPLLAPQAYSYRFTFNDMTVVTLDLAAPGSQTILAPTARSLFSGDFVNNDFSRLLMIDTDSNQYLSIDTATGTETVLGSSIPLSGHTWTGMSWDPTTGILYASASSCAESSLYTIDIATGAATIIGLVNDAGCLIDIAVSPGGQMYGVDILNDWFMAIDKSTGTGTVIGSIGFDANFAQDLDFEDATGTLYYAALNNANLLGELYTIDVGSGFPTYLGAFGADTTEIDGMGIVSSIPVPTATPEPPTATPEPPTATPEEPSPTPEPPSPTPEEPSPTPEAPTATPEDPAPTATLMPTTTPEASPTEPPPPGSTNTPVPSATPGGNPTITVPSATPRPTMTGTPSAPPSNGVSLLHAPLVLQNFRASDPETPTPFPTMTPTGSCLTREHESNNSLTEADGLPPLCEDTPLSGMGTFFTDPTDPERYDVYRLEVLTDTSVSVALNSIPTTDPDFDVFLLDATGAMVAAAQAAGDDCLVAAVVTGSYYVAVYADPHTGALPYTLAWRQSLSCTSP